VTIPRRAEDWIDAQRSAVYSGLVVILFVALTALWIGTSRDLVDSNGTPLGADFISFYAAASLGLEGHAADAYDEPHLFAAERAAVPANTKDFPWFYPPTYLLAVLPLALLPYVPALGLFIGVPLVLYLWLVRTILPDRRALLPAVAFSGVLINVLGGQNGLLSTALLGFGLLYLERRPILAGVFLGILTYKPHLGLLVPFLLVAGSYWRTIGAAVATAALFAIAATLAFGLDAWIQFFTHLPGAGLYLEAGALPWDKMASVFAAAKLMGATTTTAFIVHGSVAVSVAALTLAIWRHGDLALRVALAVTATCLISPFIYDYDLAVLAVPIALLAADGLRVGEFVPGVKSVLVAAWFAPLLGAPLARFAHLPIMPALLLAMLAACYFSWRRNAVTQSAAVRVRFSTRESNASGR
jgi:hypothetical protein